MTDPSLEDEYEVAAARFRNAVYRCYLATTEWHGKMFRPKAIPGNPHAGKIPMSFSCTLIDFAGGISELRTWWEAE